MLTLGQTLAPTTHAKLSHRQAQADQSHALPHKSRCTAVIVAACTPGAMHTCTCCLGDSCAGGWPSTTCTAGLGADSTRLTALRACAACLLPRKSITSPVLRVKRDCRPTCSAVSSYRMPCRHHIMASNTHRSAKQHTPPTACAAATLPGSNTIH